MISENNFYFIDTLEREMPKKKNQNASPSEKLLDLFSLLSVARTWKTKKELSESLECSEQTIVRMMEVIDRKLSGFAQIEVDFLGKKKMYRLRSVSDRNTLGVDVADLRSLSLCRGISKQYLSGEELERIDSSIRNISIAIKQNDVFNPGADVWFSGKGRVDYSSKIDLIYYLQSAANCRKLCKVDYIPVGSKDVKSYRYAPVKIVSSNSTIYVCGYKLEEGSIIVGRPTNFAVHRISMVEIVDEYPQGIPPHPSEQMFGLNWHEPRRVKVRIDESAADYVRDRIWSSDQEIKELDDGSIILEMTTTSEKELNSWLGSFNGLAVLVTSFEEEGRSLGDGPVDAC